MTKFRSHLKSLPALLLIAQISTPLAASESPSNAELSDENAELIFDLAMQQRDSGKVYDAIEQFEYILNSRPSLNRARLELAVSYHRAKQYNEALNEFQAVLDNPETPEKVRLAILAYLAQISSDQQQPKTEHTVSYYTKAGLLYNNNINFAPLRGSLAFTIPDGKDIVSPGLDTFLSASHQYKNNTPFNEEGFPTHYEWQSQLSWTGNNYTDTSDYSINIISASTGPAFISTGRGRSAINLQVDQAFFGGSTLGTFVSLNPSVTIDLGDYRGLTLETSYSDNNFTRSEDEGRDGNTVLAGAAYSKLLGGADNGFETGFRLMKQATDDEQYGYDGGEVYFGGFLTVESNSSLYLNLNFKQFKFDAADTTSGTVRDEIESFYTVGYNRDMSAGALQGWTLNTHISLTKNNSNVDAFSYEKTILAISLARHFI